MKAISDFVDFLKTDYMFVLHSSVQLAAIIQNGKKIENIFFQNLTFLVLFIVFIVPGLQTLGSFGMVQCNVLPSMVSPRQLQTYRNEKQRKTLQKRRRQLYVHLCRQSLSRWFCCIRCLGKSLFCT